VNTFAGLGLKIVDHHFGNATGCEFTSCAEGALLVSNTASSDGSQSWSFGNCLFGATLGASASLTSNGVMLDSLTAFFQFTGCTFYSSAIGIVVVGKKNIVSACQFYDNYSSDIDISNCKASAITSNCCNSTNALQSIEETGASDYNMIIGNLTYGTIATVGTHTVSSPNITSYFF
jgi:hypothetical protein